jgi:VWFA-related protein
MVVQTFVRAASSARRLLLALVAVIAFGAIANAQTGQAPSANQFALPRVSESIEVSIVNLDCIVTDKSGRRVRHLNRDDFEILENGKRQPVTNFAEFSDDAVTADASSSPSPEGREQSSAANAGLTPATKRTIVIFADDFFAERFSIAPIVGSLKALLSAEIRPGDAVSVIAWRNGIQIRQDLTGDLAAIGSALDRITEESYKRGPYADLIERNAEAAATRDFLKDAAGLRRSATASTRWVDSDRAGAESMGSMYARAAASRQQRKASALEQIIGTIGNIEGRKILFFLCVDSGGLRSVTRMANAYGVTIYGIYPTKPPSTFSFSEGERGGEFREDLSQPRTFAFDTYNPGGEDFRLLFAQTAGLEDASGQTGGLMAVGAPDVRRLMPRVVEDLDSYYSLAYKMTPSAGGQRKIDVRVKNPEYRVRVRGAVEDLSLGRRVVDQVRGNLVREPVPSRIATAVVVGTPIQKSKNAFILPVNVWFTAKNLTLVQAGDGRRGSFTVYLQVSRSVGPPPAGAHATFDFSSKDVERAPGGIFRYSFQLVADQYTDRISVGVLDELSGETGFAVVNLSAAAERTSSER